MINGKKVFAIIMAAGKGTRIGATDKPKVMFEVAGKPIIDWSVAPFLELKKDGIVDRIIIIVGFCGDQIIKHLGDKVEYAWQKEQLGTAHAVSQTESLLKDEEGITLIVNGDHPLYTKDAYTKTLNAITEKNLTLAFGTATSSERFDSYARVLRDESGKILGVVEKLGLTDEQIKIPERSISLYGVDNKWLFETLPKIEPSFEKKEYYIVDIIKFAIDEGKLIDAVEVDDQDGALGVNTPEEREEAEKILLGRENN